MGALIALRDRARLVLGYQHRLTGNGISGDDGDFVAREGYRIFRADYDPRATHIGFQSLVEAYQSKPGALLVRGVVVDCVAKPLVRELKKGERINGRFISSAKEIKLLIEGFDNGKCVIRTP